MNPSTVKRWNISTVVRTSQFFWDLQGEPLSFAICGSTVTDGEAHCHWLMPSGPPHTEYGYEQAFGDDYYKQLTRNRLL